MDFACDSDASSPSTLLSLSRFSENEVNVGSAISFFSWDPLDDCSDDFSDLMDLADGPFTTFTAGDAFAMFLGGDFFVGETFDGESVRLFGVLPKNKQELHFYDPMSRKSVIFVIETKEKVKTSKMGYF